MASMGLVISVVVICITPHLMVTSSAYIDLDLLKIRSGSEKNMETQIDDEVVRQNKHDFRSIDPACTIWRYKKAKCRFTRKVYNITNTELTPLRN